MKLNPWNVSNIYQIITPATRTLRLKGSPHARSTSTRHLSNGPSKSRLEIFRAKLSERYPNVSSNHLPSLTMAFLLLHELTAIVPFLGTFFIFQSTGTGEQIVNWIRTTILDKSDSQSEEYPTSMSNWLRPFISTSLEEGFSRISRIALRYGWLSADQLVSPTEPEVDRTLSMLDGGVVASGLVAYLSVKVLFPLRIGLSLYLAPSFAQYFRSFYRFFQKTKIK